MQQWNPFRETIDQILRERLRRPALPAPRLLTNVFETVDGDAFEVEIAVPGLQPDDIKVEATSDSLTVCTQPRQVEPETGRRYIHREQVAESMCRIIEFPGEIDTDRIQATMEQGILKIHVPKAAVGVSKVIKVSRAA